MIYQNHDEPQIDEDHKICLSVDFITILYTPMTLLTLLTNSGTLQPMRRLAHARYTIWCLRQSIYVVCSYLLLYVLQEYQQPFLRQLLRSGLELGL